MTTRKAPASVNQAARVVALLTTYNRANCTSSDYHLVVVGLAIFCNPSSPGTSSSMMVEHQAIKLLIPSWSRCSVGHILLASTKDNILLFAVLAWSHFATSHQVLLRILSYFCINEKTRHTKNGQSGIMFFFSRVYLTVSQVKKCIYRLPKKKNIN
jgi:hypothetical protein